jgi:hypothetical protein
MPVEAAAVIDRTRKSSLIRPQLAVAHASAGVV